MAASTANKYSNLPDIDTQPDVYETPESADGLAAYSFLKPAEPEARNDDIDGHTVSAAQALARFREATGEDPEGKGNEAATLARRHRSALYHHYLRQTLPNDGELEVSRGSVSVDETPVQRLRRLLHETQELADELGAAPESTSESQRALFAQASVLQRELSGLSSQLQDDQSATAGIFATNPGRSLLNSLQRLEVVSSDPEPVPSASVTVKSNLSTPDAAYMGKLENRVAELEQLLGQRLTSEGAHGLRGRGLLEVMGSLEGQVRLLAQPRHLESLSRRAKAVTQDLEKLAAVRAQDEGVINLDDEVGEKINRLFAVVDRVDPLIETAPAIVARLQSLQALHLEASVVGQTLRQCSESQTKIAEDTKVLQEIGTQLLANMKENTTTIQSNLTSLDGRVRDLTRRLEAL
ncbi:hypothetical protein IWQ60_003866 [Tieghemiomyces parasiticus]|uniref:Dynactin subunit 2 n=1 Tax=Tieghemiomyces parasiticus TaxID=78921 RepID=A0A9W8A8T5_9FUNG|nr:hypothetical protein IWQ60_003866 [Tieghemiomyces parasiticus]